MPQTIRPTNQCYSVRYKMKYQLLARIAFLLLILPSLYSQQEWHRLTTSDGLNSNVVININQTKNGDIWIGTDKGINHYNGVFEKALYGLIIYRPGPRS